MNSRRLCLQNVNCAVILVVPTLLDPSHHVHLVVLGENGRWHKELLCSEMVTIFSNGSVLLVLGMEEATVVRGGQIPALLLIVNFWHARVCFKSREANRFAETCLSRGHYVTFALLHAL